MKYPKMLYSPDSDTVNHSGRIVHNEVDEQEWRERGFVDYADLPEPKPKVEETEKDEAPVGFVTIEQFDAVAERLAAAEQEIERLKNPEPFVPEMKYADGTGASEGGSTDPEPQITTQAVDYNSLTTPQLQKLLDEKGIAYLKRDDKATLIGLLTQLVKTEE
ncbi:hypothetical protein [Acinetobacter sp. WCHAc060025]|uniref:hypothetical protein n=1 Tax=Acinetobacter sp. WCHAc060025 TaxID=2518625 RepID=UPI001023DA62|nr:hypothetical protein [Acinetobacter sp. WCHAc060025]RZG74739.1 hypothetical protein EXE09_12155 [Acinetobacter sp. WCHAc060025]